MDYRIELKAPKQIKYRLLFEQIEALVLSGWHGISFADGSTQDGQIYDDVGTVNICGDGVLSKADLDRCQQVIEAHDAGGLSGREQGEIEKGEALQRLKLSPSVETGDLLKVLGL